MLPTLANLLSKMATSSVDNTPLGPQWGRIPILCELPLKGMLQRYEMSIFAQFVRYYQYNCFPWELERAWCLGANVLLRKAMRCPSCCRTTPIPTLEASVSIVKVLLNSGTGQSLIALTLKGSVDTSFLEMMWPKYVVPTGRVPVPTGSIPVPAGDTMVSTDDVPVHTSSSTDLFFDDEPTTRFPSTSDLGNHDPSPGILSSLSYDDEFGNALNNVASTVEVSPIETKRINTIHPQSLIIGDHTSAVQTRSKNKRDARGIVVRNKAKLVAQGHRQEEGIDYDEVFASVARIEAIRLFLAFASYIGFMVYQMDVKSEFLYGRINEEVYVTQPKGFIDPQHPKKVYKVGKALYGLHQAPRAWYATLSTFLLKHGYRRGTIDKTLFLKKNKRDIILQRPDEMFISQDKYVQEILHKFDLGSVRTATTPYEAPKPKSKNKTDSPINVHLYRSMIVKKIFKYLKGQPMLDLWYLRESPIVLEAYSDSDYAGANKDRKSTTGGCQFLGRRLISWQCKKQTIVATSSTKAEYVVAANCCGQPHGSRGWISDFQVSTWTRSHELGPSAIQATIDETPYTIIEDLVKNQEGEGAGVAAQAVPQHMPVPDQPQDHLSPSPRQQTSDPDAPVFEHGQSSDINIASFSRTHETDDGPFTNVEDEPFFYSCAEGKQDVDLDALLAMANAIVTIDSNIPPGGASNNLAASTCVPADVPTSANVPTGSTSVPADLPTSVAPAGVSNKGKTLMVEEDIIVIERTFKQMKDDRLGEQAAKRLHDKEQAQVDKQRAELQRRRQQEVLASSMYYTEANWINIMARVEANASLFKTLMGDDVSEDNFPAIMAALIKRKKQALAEKLAKERMDRPMTQGQQRTYIRYFVKNQSSAVYSTGWSMAYVKSFTDDQLKKEFKKIQQALSNIQNQAFSRTLKRTSPVLEEPSSKRQKSTEAPILSVPEVPQSPIVSSPKSSDTRRKSLGRKHEAHLLWSALVGWEVITTHLGDINALYRIDRSIAHFTTLREILHMVDRQDLVLFDSHESGKGSFVWHHQHLWQFRSWRLYTLSIVHVLKTVSGEVVYMFAYVSYPFSVKLMERMLKHKLEIDKDVVGNDMTTVEQLIQFIKNQLTVAQVSPA
nr:putative ribonuclease H-like domain-containing protein [Tanacetum cinerariifolium]